MTLVCDGCGDEIEGTPRPEAAVPVSDGGMIDLCQDCKTVLSRYSEIESAVTVEHDEQVHIEVHEDTVLCQTEGRP